MTKLVLGLAALTTLTAVAACSSNGSSASTSSMASPSATMAAAGTGQIVSMKHDDGKSEIEGLIASIDATAHSFAVSGTTVTVSSSTQIRHGGTPLTFADLKVGDRVHVEGARSGATVAASEVMVQNEQAERPAPDHVSLEGQVAGMTGTCPALTFTLGTTKVTTTSMTRFHEGRCDQIVNGKSVRARGTAQSDGSIVATSVALDDEPDGDHDGHHDGRD